MRIRINEEARALLKKAEECTTEDEVENVSDMAWNALQFRKITKKNYNAICEVLDDKLLDLAEDVFYEQ